MLASTAAVTIRVMEPTVLDRAAFEALVRQQSGVVSRRQVVELGGHPHDLRALVRRREFFRVHPGVYVNHATNPTWLQRSWAAVLGAWPAALWGPSAMRAVDGPGRTDADDRVIHVAVAGERNLVEPPGVRIHRVDALELRVQWNTSPPRVRYDEAALDVALRTTSEFDAVAALARGLQTRHTTATRLREVLAARPRVPHRGWLDAVLRDLETGSCSVLEQAYLERVERAHGLPVASRQVADDSRQKLVYRDAEYAGGLIVELDGRLFHDSATTRDADMERDLDAATDGRRTIRLSWGQVVERGCSTAGKVGQVLALHGWSGFVQPCSPDCGLTSALAG